MNLPPQFSARLDFTFQEAGADDSNLRFIFGDDGHRRVPMRMDGVEGMNTVGIWIDSAPAIFHPGDQVDVQCILLAPELFDSAVEADVKFELWDGKFFAKGVVIERFTDGWPT